MCVYTGDRYLFICLFVYFCVFIHLFIGLFVYFCAFIYLFIFDLLNIIMMEYKQWLMDEEQVPTNDA